MGNEIIIISKRVTVRDLKLSALGMRPRAMLEADNLVIQLIDEFERLENEGLSSSIWN